MFPGSDAAKPTRSSPVSFHNVLAIPWLIPWPIPLTGFSLDTPCRDWLYCVFDNPKQYRARFGGLLQRLEVYGCCCWGQLCITAAGAVAPLFRVSCGPASIAWLAMANVGGL